MAIVCLYTFASVIIVSLLSLVGVLSLTFSGEKLKKITMFLVSLSAGTLLGGALLHLLPEAVEEHNGDFKIWLWLLAGIIIFFVLEKIIHWRHCHIPTSEEHPHPLGAMNLIGDGLHNFIDGMIIAGSFLISAQLGFATTIAVIAHEIPQEIGDFGVLIHAGYKRGKALLFNFLTGLTAVIGAAITLLIGTRFENFSAYIIPFTAGGFIYIATADLIPELKKDTQLSKSFGQLAAILLGIGIMLIMKD
ncbi:ZIP family metal transporter [Patescibacteria group bacterium]|nr:ZIP family metal transporter [Patescibacteria group bacterium]MBU4455299.1 ZIP family metal transporter [Patescibacteria group bacterium]